MKIISMFAFTVVSGVFVWFAGNTASIEARSFAFVETQAACRCADEADLGSRLRAVDAAILALQQQTSLERWQEAFDPAIYQKEIGSMIASALGSTGSGRFGAIVGNLDPNTCAIRPESLAVSSCFALSIAKNLETRKEACENWRTGDGRTGTDYRSGHQTNQIIEDEIAAYRNEKDFLEEQLRSLESTQCSDRSRPGGTPPVAPPVTPPGTTPPNPRGTVPPSRVPPGIVPPIPFPPGTVPPGTIPGGIPIGIPPGPPRGGPPVLPPIPPPDDPPIIPPSGTGGPIGVRRTSGYVQYILDLVMDFPVLGSFKYKGNSRIPFNITQNRVTGGGTIVMELDTSATVCTASNFDATVDVIVSGQQVGNNMNVTVVRQPSGATGPSFAEKVANIRLDCKVGGRDAFAFNIPNPLSNLTPAVQQRLPLPPVGGRPTTTVVPVHGLPGRIVLRVYRP